MTNAVDENTNASIKGPVPVSSTSSLDSIPGISKQVNNPIEAQSLGVSMEASQQTNAHFPVNAVAPSPTQQFPASDAAGVPPLSNATHMTTSLGAGALSTSSASSSVYISPNATSSVPVPIMPSLPSNAPQSATPAPANTTNTVAEFLYQLTKMLTEDNKEVIEWSNGRIEVHNPHKLASEVLHKYFRHSKFASFQRQLNYFGFRKFAGKGKMSPCSYVNDSATSDLRSLLSIKRKTSATTAKDKNSKKRERTGTRLDPDTGTSPVNPVLAGILQRSSVAPEKRVKVPVARGIRHGLSGMLHTQSTPSMPPVLRPPSTSSNSHVALAKSAVGKGVRHRFAGPSTLPQAPSSLSVLQETSTGEATAALANSSSSQFTFKEPHQLGMEIQSSLSELSNNFRNSLNDATKGDDLKDTYYGMLSRDSSLVDLAMIPPVEAPVDLALDTDARVGDNLMTFVDFPHDVYKNSQSREDS